MERKAKPRVSPLFLWLTCNQSSVNFSLYCNFILRSCTYTNIHTLHMYIYIGLLFLYSTVTVTGVLHGKDVWLPDNSMDTRPLASDDVNDDDDGIA